MYGSSAGLLEKRKADVVKTLVRCPHGWNINGPHCSTVIAVLPYTECPGDAEQFERGFRASMVVAYPGVCSKMERTGLMLKCKEGFILGKKILSSKPLVSVDVCSGVDIIKRSMLLPSQPCPSGYIEVLEGCRADQEFAPSVECPEGYVMGLISISPYVFRGKEYVECIRTTNFKGKAWCPEGFTHFNVPFPDNHFGEEVADLENPEIPLQRIRFEGSNFRRLSIASLFSDLEEEEEEEEYSEVKKEWVKEEVEEEEEERKEEEIGMKWNNHNDSQPSHFILSSLSSVATRKLQEETVLECVQSISVFSANCDQYKCKTPYLKRLERAIRHWLYYKLNTDPDLVNEIIPSGKDLLESL